jgi:GT2 family glycosyltransferase
VSTGKATGRPCATVIVCTKNRPQFLPDCLRTVDADLGADDDAIVVEDGDSGAAATMPELAKRWLHLREPDHWKTWSMNRGIERATGDVILFTDDECRIPEGWIDGMVAAFDDPGVGIAFGPVDGMTHIEGTQPHPPLPPGPAPFVPWVFSHGASMAVRRSAIEAIGGFDERLGPGRPTGTGEEPDVILRMAEAGWSCAIAPAPTVQHVEWRDDSETFETLMRYERGSGAWLGVAIRRTGWRQTKMFLLRLQYQAQVIRHPGDGGRRFAFRALIAFFGGVRRGLASPPRRWLNARSVTERDGQGGRPLVGEVGDAHVDQPTDP